MQVADSMDGRPNDGAPRLFAVSGRMASGKDTIAELAEHTLFKNATVHRIAFADALRREINRMLDAVRINMEHPSNDIISELSTVMGCTIDEARNIVDILQSELVSNPDAEAHQHDDKLRMALQYWGTDVRREQDADYWVRITKNTIAGLLDTNDNNVVIVTDARFPNELDAIHDCGGVIVRLDVSRDVQLKRLRDRDGVVPVSKLNHISESAADDYTRFDVRINADDKTPDEIIGSIACHFNHQPI